jgi:TPR repeat protein
MKRIPILFLAITLCACRKLSQDEGSFLNAQKAYEKQNYAIALAQLKPLVESGHPGAQLLLAKMYSYGQGVKFDGGKAELLRNLAMLRLTARGVAQHGSVEGDPFMKALDTTLRDPDNGAVNETLQQLAALDPNQLEKMTDQMQNDLPNTLEQEGPVSVPVLTSAGVSPALAAAPPLAVKIPANTRRANGISLGLLRRSADQGDRFAMKLLASAYTHGYYGLTPDPHQALKWLRRAAQAGMKANPENSDEDAPSDFWMQLGPALGVGGLLVALGIWQARRVRRGHRKAH